MFFKDLTRVEQLEERERLRDRLAAVGEMAAVIAHEVKNPLAGIEVMAGLLRRKIADTPDAQAVLTDIINEAKMANAIVQEVLDFVRPIRLQVEHTRWPTRCRGRFSWRIRRPGAARGGVRRHPRGPCRRFRRTNISYAGVHQPPDERLRGDGRLRARQHHGEPAPPRGRRRARTKPSSCRSPTTAGHSARRGGKGVRPVLHDEAAGLRAGTGNRAEDRRRTRRTDRPAHGRLGQGADHSRDAAGIGAAGDAWPTQASGSR